MSVTATIPTAPVSLVSLSDLRRVTKYASLNKMGLQPSYLMMASRREIPILGSGGDHCLDIMTTDQRVVVSGLQILVSMIFMKKKLESGKGGGGVRGLMGLVMGYLALPTQQDMVSSPTHQAPLYRSVISSLLNGCGGGVNRVPLGSKRGREDDDAENVQSATTSSHAHASAAATAGFPPLFFIDAPFNSAHSLFVAMYAVGTLTDEELNTYFGRYGFIGSKKVALAADTTHATTTGDAPGVSPVPSTPAEQAGSDAAVLSSPVAGRPPTSTAAVTASSSVEVRDNIAVSNVVTPVKNNITNKPPLSSSHHHLTNAATASSNQLLSSPCLAQVQCFVIILDSNKQCIRALTELRHSEVLFMAPHETSRNDLSLLPVGQYLVNTLSLNKAPVDANTTTTTTTPVDVATRQLLSVVGSVVAHPPGTPLFNHVAAGLKVLHNDSTALLAELREAVNSIMGPAGVGGGRGGAAGDADGDDSRPRDLNDPDGVLIRSPLGDGEGEGQDESGIHLRPEVYFVPDVIIDNIPYWCSVDSVRDRVSAFGVVMQVQPSISDRNGSMQGSMLVKMRSVREARRLCDGLNGEEYEEGWGQMTVGVVSTELNLEALDAAVVLSGDMGKSDIGAMDGCDQPRMWI